MTRLQVPDMTCKHCVATITKVIQEADSAAKLHIDLSKHLVEVEGKLAQDQLISLLEDAGYTPSAA